MSEWREYWCEIKSYCQTNFTKIWLSTGYAKELNK